MQGLLSITPLRFGCIWPFFVHIAWYFFVHVESPVLSMTRLFPSWLQRHLSFHLRELKKSSRQVWTYRYVFMNTCVTRTSVFLHSWSAGPRAPWLEASERGEQRIFHTFCVTYEWMKNLEVFVLCSKPAWSLCFFPNTHTWTDAHRGLCYLKEGDARNELRTIRKWKKIAFD